MQLTRLKRTLAGLLDGHPRLLFPALRLFAGGKYDGTIVGPGTELVISGYPRSANSFATMAVYLAHPGIAMASHLHAPAEIVAAARLGIPAIVLIRQPEDAIRSLMAADPGTDESRELERWIRYHERVEPLHEHYVISPFERTIADFGGVIAEVNARFGTHFAGLEPTEENRARVFERLAQSQDQFGSHRFGGQPGDRAARLRGTNVSLDPKLLARARALYDRFEHMSGSRGEAQ